MFYRITFILTSQYVYCGQRFRFWVVSETGFCNIISDIYKEGFDLLDFDSSKKVELYSMANLNNSIGAYARNILKYTDTLTYIEPVIWPSFFKAHKLKRRSNELYFNNKNIRVYPNPSNTYVIIEWNLLALNNAEVNIFNMEGRLIERFSISDYKGYKIINTENLPGGVYICRLTDSKEINDTFKFIIEH